MHRIWAFAAGVPVGILAALAVGNGWLTLDLGALAGGFAMLLCATLAGRRASPEAERAQIAGAASLGLAALPAAGGHWLGLLPGARIALPVVILAVAFGFFRAMRGHGPRAGFLQQAATAGAALAAGAILTFAAAGLLAAFGRDDDDAERAEKRAQAALDVDASVALGPDAGCAPEAARVTEIARGAHPALSEGGAFVWFDAQEPDGHRQVHRLERSSASDTCWTCGEPGSNRRPRVSPNGSSLVYETDRYVSAFEPLNWEIEIASAKSTRPGRSRRLTFDPGPDTRAGFAPGGSLLLWSSGSDGRHVVATAGLRSGHGGLLLSPARAVARGGASWIVPLAWSPDARALVWLRGDPLGVQETTLVDPATGARRALAWRGVRAVAADFSADGTRIAVATTRPAAATAALPKAAGFLTARLAALGGGEPTRFRVSGVRIGATAAPDLDAVALGEHEAWGHPTGIALEPDGRAFVLGQRDASGEERLIRVELRCQPLP